MASVNYITPVLAKTLPGLLTTRLAISSESDAYGYYDEEKQTWQSISWSQVAKKAAIVQAALKQENFSIGDRVAIMLRNCPDWVIFDVAALGLGLVTVPLYTNDRAENIAYIIKDAGIKLLLIQNQRQWKELSRIDIIHESLQRVISLESITQENISGRNLIQMQDWINKNANSKYQSLPDYADDLATIVYTSGTTGRPKGVMLSHKNILSNAYAALHCGEFFSNDVFLSFLPLSHALERTGGCFLPMMSNSKVYFARSIQHLAEDIQNVRPTILVSVPRIYEMIYSKVFSSIQKQSSIKQKLFSWAQKIGWRRYLHNAGRSHWHWSVLFWPVLNWLVASKINQGLGGRLRYAIAGGAALNKSIAKFFISLGVPIFQGYGMTECSPIISVGRPEDNDPFSIGKALPGVETKITEEGELCTRSESVMMGYFNNKKATDKIIDSDGWLHTGDIATISNEGYLYITGRIKDIIVMANAEKVSPQDMEGAICANVLFDQAMILGEGKPFLAALVVLNESEWIKLANDLNVDSKLGENLNLPVVQKAVLMCISDCLNEFPGYAQIRRVNIYLDAWTIENGLLTPTLKIKRAQILKRFSHDIDKLFESLRT